MKNMILLLLSGLYAECYDYNQFECNNEIGCQWVEDIEYGNCSEFNQDSTGCEETLGCWGAYQYPGWYSGWYCAGGNYQIDNSSCQEIQMPECSEMFENQCINSESCEWIIDIDYFSCSNFNQSQCSQYESCSWTLQYGGSYGQWSYECSGLYSVDHSYCQDYQPPLLECSSHLEQYQCEDYDCQWVPDVDFEDCSLYNESLCYEQDSCNWVENIQYGYCYNLNEASCDANPNCYYDCEFWHGSCAGCCYGSCLGGSYIISDNSYCNGEPDNGYCTEPYILGDLDSDGNINVVDIVDLVNIVLNAQYNFIGDINQDGTNNIVDIISLVNIVLGN